MELRHIREFFVLSETLNFSEAARQLFISQPALSTHVANIEQELGFSLLDRSGRKPRLTKAGRQFAQKARALQGEWNQMVSSCAQVAYNEEHAIKMFNLASYFNQWPVVSAVVSEHADELVFDIVAYPPSDKTTTTADCLNTTVDLMTWGSTELVPVAQSVLEAEGFDCVYMGTGDFAIWTTVDNPLTRLDRVTPADLDGYHLILRNDRIVDNLYDVCLQRLAQAGIDLPICRTDADYGDQLPFLDFSQAMCLCHSAYYEGRFGQLYSHVRRLTVEGVDPTFNTWLVTRRRDEPMRRFMGLLREAMHTGYCDRG